MNDLKWGRSYARAMVTAPVAAASLVVGYGVATGTGRRPLGELVFAAGTAWCGREWVRRRSAPAAATLVGVQLGAFFASHRLAPKLGAWPSVITTSAISGAAAAIVGDRRRTTKNP
jgi:hypothetical protein